LDFISSERDDRVWGKPNEKEWDEIVPYWHLAGNGGILSTTEDLYKWHLALLSNEILSKDALQKYYHPDNAVNREFTARILQVLSDNGMEKALAEYQARNEGEELNFVEPGVDRVILIIITIESYARLWLQ